MIGMNAIFHIASAIFLGGLFYYLVQIMKQLHLVQQLWRDTWGSGQGTGRVFVGEPVSFLKTLCAALGLSWDQGEQRSLPPQRILTSEFFQALSRLGVEGLAVVGQDNGKPKVRIVQGAAVQPEVVVSAELQRMMDAFSHKFEFVAGEGERT